MSDGPFQRFCDELDELIERWRDKPEDDQLSCAEIVGALEFKKHIIIYEAQASEEDEEA